MERSVIAEVELSCEEKCINACIQDCIVHECGELDADDQLARGADCRQVSCNSAAAHEACEDCEWDDWWGGFDNDNER